MLDALIRAATLTLLTGLSVLTGFAVEQVFPPLRQVTRSIPLTRIGFGLASWIAVAFALAVAGQLTGISITAIAVAAVATGTPRAYLAIRRWLTDRAESPAEPPQPPIREVLCWIAWLLTPLLLKIAFKDPVIVRA